MPDFSTRFVLPADDPYIGNLAALWRREPALAAAIEALDFDSALPIEPSRSGAPTLRRTTADGANLYLHSRYDPLAEAVQTVSGVNPDGREVLFVLGFGLGYHLDALLPRSAGCDLWIVEPDLTLLLTAMRARDLRSLIESKQVHWLWQADKSSAMQQLHPHIAAIHLGFGVIEHLPSMRINPSGLMSMRQIIDEFAEFSRTTVNTLILNGRKTAENIAGNLPWYVATPSLSRLKDAYANKPAIIVSAGPSLAKNKHLLPRASGNAVMIAVQTTFKPLLELGIEPDFVTSLDYHDICTRFFENLPAGCRSELVAEPKATSKVFDLHPGALSLNGNDFADRLLAEMSLGKSALPAGATVAHLAYYLAEHLGCDPIIFVGQDLGFSGGLCYTPGTSYDDVWRPEIGRFCTSEMKQWEQIVRDRPILKRVPDIDGRPTYTEARLFSYLQQFERDFARSRRRIIDATEGGVLKRGSTPMPLRDAIEQFCTSPIGARPAHPGWQWQHLPGAVNALLKRRDEAARIRSISEQTLPLLEQVRDAIGDGARVNGIIAKIDPLRAQMNELGGTYELLMQLTQPTEIRRYQADRRIAAAGEDGPEKQRRQVVRDIDNVRAVIESAGEFEKMIDRAIARLEAFADRHSPRRAA